MTLRKAVSSLILAGALATTPMLAFGQAQYLDKGATPGKAAASGAEGASGGLTTGTVAAGVAVAAVVAVAIAVASDSSDSTTVTMK